MTSDNYDLIFDNEAGVFLPRSVKRNIQLNLSNKNLNNQHGKEINELQQHIKATAESVLYEWQHFSIVFPPSLSGINDNGENANFKIEQLFVIPSSNELDEVSTDSNGRPKMLDKKQLASIYQNGEFDVDSKNLPGQVHKWRLARWLQLGTIKSNEYLYKDLSTALSLIIVQAKRRLVSNFFSLKRSVSAWKCGTKRLLDILIGLPAMRVVSFGEKLLEEEQKFLIAELIVDVKEEEKLNRFIDQFSRCVNDYKGNGAKFPERFVMPYVYRTCDGLPIDLRLFDEKLRERLNEVLTKLMDFDNDEDRTWFASLRKELVMQFKAQGLSSEEIVQNVTDEILSQYFDRVFDKILRNDELNTISPNIGKTLVDHARSILIMQNALKKVKKIRDDHLSEYRKQLIQKYRIKSKVAEWLDDCVQEESLKFTRENLYTANVIAIEELRLNNLHQAAYFLNREILFRKNHEQQLTEEFSKIKEPAKTFSVHCLIWFPKNWIITRIEENKEPQRVPVVFGDGFYEDTSRSNDNGKFRVQKYVEYKNTTRYPFWRWTNVFIRTWAYCWNVAFGLGIIIPLCSPVSFTALFKLEPFHPNKQLDSRTGKIHPTRTPQINTFASRIRAIWQHVRESRTRFERIPDKGLIGKSFQRVFNVIWNYVVKGAVGTLAVTAVFPVLCLSVSTLCIAASILTPIWFPILNLAIHIFSLIFFDCDCPYNNKGLAVAPLLRIIFGDFLICGIVQPVLAIATAFGFCPAASIIIVLYAFLRKTLRKIWDSLMFYVVLKPRARIPSRDTFVARRFAGPGLASNYFYQIDIEQALVALEAHLEKDELDSYLQIVTRKLNEPVNEYVNFFNTLNEPFSCKITGTVNSTYEQVQEKSNSYLKIYRNITERRKALLQPLISSTDLSKIRLKTQDLKILFSKAIDMVQTQYTKTILPYQNKSTSDLFRDQGLEDGDWSMLTGIILEDIFGKGFLNPLEETDNYFHLEVNHLNLTKYSKMIANSNLRDDLDEVMTRYDPKSGRIVISMPHKDTSLFDPLNDYSSAPHRSEKLCVPSRLPIQTGVIALLINNNTNPTNKIEIQSFQRVNAIIRDNLEKRN